MNTYGCISIIFAAVLGLDRVDLTRSPSIESVRVIMTGRGPSDLPAVDLIDEETQPTRLAAVQVHDDSRKRQVVIFVNLLTQRPSY